MYVYLTGILLFIQTADSISVASTPNPYTAAVGTSSSLNADYASSTTIEPAVADYKFNHPHNQYPYSRQFFEPLFTPSSQYSSESLTSPNPLTPKAAFLFHRLPFFPTPSVAPYSSVPSSVPYPTPAAEQLTLSPYNLPGYAAQPPYNLPGFVNQHSVDPHYPLSFPQRFVPKNPFSSDCEYHSPSAFRNTKPILFYPHKPENYYETPIPLAKPTNAFYKYQHLPYGTSFANNIYHWTCYFLLTHSLLFLAFDFLLFFLLCFEFKALFYLLSIIHIHLPYSLLNHGCTTKKILAL